MVTLKEAQKLLNEAETLLAKMKGEQAVAQRQYDDSLQALSSLGISPEQVDTALVTLSSEMTSAQADLQKAMTELAGAMGVTGA